MELKLKDLVTPARNILHTVLMLVGLIFAISACSPSSTEEAQTQTQAPASADAGMIQLTTAGNLITLDASGSTGAGISYHWIFRSVPAGSIARLSDFEVTKPSFIADQPGSYIAQLIVMDSANGTSKDFAVVNIAPTTVDGLTETLLDHTGLNANCQECHDGVNATGKPAIHIESTNECVVCHSVAAWSPNIAIDHNEILGTCSTCHNGIRAPGKPDTHIETTAECNLCHNAGTTFTIAVMPSEVLTTLDDEDEEEEDDHPPIGALMCVDCHNNVVEEGKPDDHIPASDNCAACHTTSDWEDGFGGGGSSARSDDDDEEDDDEENDHPPIGNLMCIDCHNNIVEEGKEDDHILATDMCEACHNTNDWEPVVTVDHTQVIGECSSCHNNDIARGKPRDHIETTSECNVCHGTAEWSSASSGGGNAGRTIDHSAFTAATVCMDCHNGTIATGKPDGHVITSSDCDVCHTTTAW